MKKFYKTSGIALFILVFVFVTAKLFFEESFENAIRSLVSFRKIQTSGSEITIGLASELTSLNPLDKSVQNRERLVQIYEGLVATDADLKIQPALAVSYGAVDDLTWEFRLRPNVFFHDKTKLIVEDVIESVKAAAEPNIADMQKIDAERLQIKTMTVDPLLLQKLASVFIYPAHAKETVSILPIGTGPYVFENVNEGNMVLKRFTDYWGPAPAFETVILKRLRNRDQRKDALVKGDVDLLTNVPPETMDGFPKKTYELMIKETLETNFLMFGFNGPFDVSEIREAAILAFDSSEVAKLALGYAKPVTQFVGSGIYGYDPSIVQSKPDSQKAFDLIQKIGRGARVKIAFDTPLGLAALSEFVSEKLKRVGFVPEVNLLSPKDLENKILAGGSDLYFFGWRSELGDASSFLHEVVHSRTKGFGKFNGSGYRNKKVDRLIQESDKILSPLERLEKLRQAMKVITEEDKIGIPLFTPETLYAVKPALKWTPRIDGYVLAKEVEIAK